MSLRRTLTAVVVTAAALAVSAGPASAVELENTMISNYQVTAKPPSQSIIAVLIGL